MMSGPLTVQGSCPLFDLPWMKELVLKKVWTLRLCCEDLNPSSPTYYLYDLRQVISFLCALVLPSVKWGYCEDQMS